tara:strand:+ start:321 stop:491 length:171 start_codon:yes stop_codon:yes gene_type:complete
VFPDVELLFIPKYIINPPTKTTINKNNKNNKILDVDVVETSESAVAIYYSIYFYIF